MKTDIIAGFLCGDERQTACARKLADMGYECAVCGFEKYKGDLGLCTKIKNIADLVEMSDVLVLPLPATTDGITVNAPFSEKTIYLSDIFPEKYDKKLLLYGNSKIIEKYANEYNIKSFDYCEREDLILKNALLTAEGVIGIALSEMKESLYESKCLVVGYGRIGKILSQRLKAFGAKVFASSRKAEKLFDAEMNGIVPVKNENLKKAVKNCSLIVNTVPQVIIDESVLREIDEKTLIIDVASKPGGIDFEKARNRKLNVIWALGLPGKTAPETAGRFEAETLDEIITENAQIFGG